MRRVANLCLLVALSIASLLSFAQTGDTGSGIDRQRALDLYSAQKYQEALPLLEKLSAAFPKDIVLQERFGASLFFASSGILDPKQRKRERLRARTALLHAKELRDNSNLLQILLGGIPEDGSDRAFSSNKQIEQIMREGEAAFHSGNLQKALDSYANALALDPKLYAAALYSGDTYFNMKQYDKAAEWFARAIQINPNQETAYRYWGDSFMMQGDMKSARAKFIDAVVADPYIRNSQMGLQQWAQQNHVRFNVPRIVSPNSIQPTKKGMTLTVNPSVLNAEDGSSAWLIADMGHMIWEKEKFRQEYPREKTYRHSLKEESERLHMVAEALRQQLKDKSIKSLDPNLAALLKLEDAGLVESYILISAPDQGIAQDYTTYREQNRDKLRRYLDEFVVPKI